MTAKKQTSPANPLHLEELLERTTIHARSPENINCGLLADILNRHSFAVIRGLVDPDNIVAAKKRFTELYSPNNDNPATGEDPSDIMDNYQKLSVGGAEHSGVYRPRCMRTLYNPVWAEDLYGLRKSFVLAAQTRNIIYGFDLDFAVHEPQDGFWTAARIHHFPAGGGFLVSHVDDVVPVVQKAEGISRYYQPLIVMSKKGTGDGCDFETGGGFFETDGTRYYYEEGCEIGDIVIYSGATVHGVADIDLHRTFDSRSSRGRLAGFVTLYRVFDHKGQLRNYVGGPKNRY